MGSTCVGLTISQTCLLFSFQWVPITSSSFLAIHAVQNKKINKRKEKNIFTNQISPRLQIVFQIEQKDLNATWQIKESLHHRLHFPNLRLYKDHSIIPLIPHQFFFWFFLALQTRSFSLSLSLIFPFIALYLSPGRHELANPQETLEETDSVNQRVVRALYEALNSRDVEKVHSLLSPDLDWWFHGPPSHQFLMRLLTGAKPDDQNSSPFRFNPQSFASFGPTVIVEGCDYDRSIAWVHAWTVTNGIITQVREYFNTSLTVTRLGSSSAAAKSSPSDYASSSSSSAEIASYHCPSVWESSLSDLVGKSVPGLVLAI